MTLRESVYRIWLFSLPLLLFSCDSLQNLRTSNTGPTTTQFNSWIHAPLHPDNNTPVKFTINAADAAGIHKVVLHLYEYELFKDENGLPSKKRRKGGEWGLVKSWDIEGSKKEINLSYLYNKGFRKHSNVEYIFTITNSRLQESNRLAIFDAGDSPWPQDKITLYSTSRESLNNTINICFFPDTDYNENWNLFKKDVENLIYNGYHKNNKIAEHKENWSFFYTQQEANGFRIFKEPFKQEYYPPFMRGNYITGIDAFGLLHRQEYSDGAYLKGNFEFLAFNLFTSESYNIGTAVHETAHTIFNLSDEYDSCVCFIDRDGGGNVFKTELECKNFNITHGFSPDECSPINHINGTTWYMSERNVHFETLEACQAFNQTNNYDLDGCQKLIDIHERVWYRSLPGLCIMQDDGDKIIRDFKRTCGAIIDDFYVQLEVQKKPDIIAATDYMPNIFGYEPIVLLELNHTSQIVDIVVKEVEYGIPTKNICDRNALQLSMMNEAGVNRYNINLNNPSQLRVHAENNDKDQSYGSGKCLVMVPYHKDLVKVNCKESNLDNEVFGTKGLNDAKVIEREFQIKSDLNKAYNLFQSKQ